MIKEQIQEWNKALEGKTIDEMISFVLEKVEGRKVFSTSFGIEDQMLTHVLYPYVSAVNVFTLDTGRQFNEIYEVFHKTLNKYPLLEIATFFPEEEDIRNYVNNVGINGFYQSIENRKECCRIRKVKPLKRALEGANLWITGLRAEQSTNRESMPFLEWDESFQLIKFNPLLNYSLEEVEHFMDEYRIPINSLYKKGYLSIGCAPCTRALEKGEDFRAGRWWWENGKKECGLHIQSDKNN
nr:phosphoadenylyl-sulfate reductase [Flavobacterium sp. '19STA2R22 D10 B1']